MLVSLELVHFWLGKFEKVSHGTKLPDFCPILFDKLSIVCTMNYLDEVAKKTLRFPERIMFRLSRADNGGGYQGRFEEYCRSKGIDSRA